MGNTGNRQGQVLNMARLKMSEASVRHQCCSGLPSKTSQAKTEPWPSSVSAKQHGLKVDSNGTATTQRELQPLIKAKWHHLGPGSWPGDGGEGGVLLLILSFSITRCCGLWLPSQDWSVGWTNHHANIFKISWECDINIRASEKKLQGVKWSHKS